MGREDSNRDLGTVNIEDLNSGKSYRDGEVVYYNPADSGPYTDGQDALSDTPNGGLFIIAAGTDYDVAAEGRLTQTRGITISGEGWHEDENNNIVGTRLINTGADVVDSPVIEFAGDATGGNDRGAQVKDLYIEHEGATSYAVEFTDMANGVVSDLRIHCADTGFGGIHIGGSSFLSYTESSLITEFTGFGMKIDGSGSVHKIDSCQAVSTNAATAAIQTERPATMVMGGQYNVTDTAGVGVRFYNTESAGITNGLVQNAFFESGAYGVEIDGDTNPFNGVTVFNCRNGGSCDTHVRFGLTYDSRLVYPTVDNGEFATWSSDARRNTATLDYTAAATSGQTDNGSNKSLIVVPVDLPDSQLSVLPTASGIPIALPFSQSHNSPVVFDGTDWQEMNTTTFTP